MTESRSIKAGNPSATFEGEVVLITGGSSGIGFATARRFLDEGASVSILALDDAQLAKATEELRAQGGTDRVLVLGCDVREEGAVGAAFQKTLAAYGDLNVVVSNAGTVLSAPLEETSLEQWKGILDVHMTGYFLVAREAVRMFKRLGHGGSIVFVVSDNALKTGVHNVAYNAAKAGELHMARSIAEEYGPDGIRVNSVLPGAVFGGSRAWSPEFRAKRAAIRGLDPNNLEEEYRRFSALRVIIMPEEVAGVILFLSSDIASKITGAAVSIDGGGSAAYVR